MCLVIKVVLVTDIKKKQLTRHINFINIKQKHKRKKTIYKQ